MESVECVAREGLACAVHMELEVQSCIYLLELMAGIFFVVHLLKITSDFFSTVAEGANLIAVIIKIDYHMCPKYSNKYHTVQQTLQTKIRPLFQFRF